MGRSGGPQGEPGDDTDVRRPSQINQQGDGVGSLLVSRSKERHESSLGLGSPVSPVPTPHFSIDHGWPHTLLTSPVRGIDAIDGEKGEQSVALMAKMLDKAAVGVVGMGLVAQQVEALADVDDRRASTLLVEVPGLEGFEQEIADLAGRGPGPARQVGDHLVASPDEVGVMRNSS